MALRKSVAGLPRRPGADLSAGRDVTDLGSARLDEWLLDDSVLVSEKHKKRRRADHTVIGS